MEQNTTNNPEVTKPTQSTDPDIESSKTIAALSYVWILFLVPLLGKRDSKFAQAHAKQGLVLFVVELIASILLWVPILGQLLMLAIIIVCVLGIVKALNGEYWEIPYIYKWSKKINL